MRKLFLLYFFALVANFVFAQTGINTIIPKARLEVQGTLSSPLTSGSLDNGVVRISTSSSSGSNVLDIGNNGTTYSWLQPRLNSDYSANYNLLLNPNGGNILIGGASNNAKLNVAGDITSTGTIRSTQTGQLLNTLFLDETDLGISSTQTFENTTKNIVQYSYTPVSSSSKILIEFHSRFTIPGSNSDQWKSYLKIGSTTIQTQTAVWNASDGAGGRGAALFPIRGVYSNTTGNQITINIDVEEVSGDDKANVFADMILVIREVAQ
jgi:hypothetical protein